MLVSVASPFDSAFLTCVLFSYPLQDWRLLSSFSASFFFPYARFDVVSNVVRPVCCSRLDYLGERVEGKRVMIYLKLSSLTHCMSYFLI